MQKIKRLLRSWLGDASAMERLIAMEKEIADLRSCVAEQASSASACNELIQQIMEAHRESVSRKSGTERFADQASISGTAILSDEALVENTHGDRTKISVGENSYVRGRLLTYGHGGNISIGEWCYVGVRTEIWSMESITIGNRVLISHDVNIHDGTAHSADATERHQHFRSILTKGHPAKAEDLPGVKSAPVIIEDDVWINFGVSILRGVRIGKGSVISAGAIVTKDVPPNVIYQCEVRPILKPMSKQAEGSLSK